MPSCNLKKERQLSFRPEEQKLLGTLKKYKEAIAWSIEDLKGISPSICMHKILLEENARTSVEHQRSSQKRSAEMAKCSLHICNLRQSLDKPSTCGSKERRINCDKK